MSAPRHELHVPVMLTEVLEALAPRDGARYLDGTFGRGGYSRAILAAADTRVVGIDRDPEAVAEGRRLEGENARFTMVEGRFGEMEQLAQPFGPIGGIALDLGVSSPQIDQAERGFSFREDGPLDMRMGQDGPSAADVVNETAEPELADIIWSLGEERRARAVARAIVERRALQPITRTLDLADIVRSVVRRANDRLDPATRTFQALRLYVNDELGELDRGLAAAERLLAPGGRLAVVSFHSLEDTLVKRFLADRMEGRPQGSRHLPVAVQGDQPTFRLLFKGALKPGAEEIRLNPRAASARLRAAERTDVRLGGVA